MKIAFTSLTFTQETCEMQNGYHLAFDLSLKKCLEKLKIGRHML